jgi:hypothetical protein
MNATIEPTALRALVEQHFTERLASHRADDTADGVEGVLYESVALRCAVADGVFTATLSGGLDEIFPGVPSTVSTPADELRITAALDQIDQWARLRLSEAYLAAREAARNDPPEDEPRVLRADLDAPAAVLLALRFFGPKLTAVTADTDGLGISGLLYGVFDFGSGVQDDGAFSAAVLIDERFAVRDYLGREVPLEADPGSITAGLEAIDRWCRLRLPSRYLAEHGFDTAAGADDTAK